MTSSGETDRAVNARQASADIFQMMLAYKKTALLRAGVELGIFTRLAAGRASATEVATDCELSTRGARLLLNGLVAIDLLDEDGGAYTLAARAAATLVPGRDGYLGDLTKVLVSTWEWDAMRSLPEAARRGGPVTAEHAETPDYAYWEEFATYAGAVTRPTTQLLTGHLHDWAAGRDRLDILDLACGHGLYGYSLAQQHPHARVCSVDGPKVLEIAQKHAARLGVADRVQTLPGDMFALPLGGPYDLVLVTNVLHHYAEDQAVELLRRAAAVTVPGGRIALVGITLEEGPVRANAEAHLFSLLMLVWTTQGEAHSSAAYERMLTAAGYTGMRLHRQSTLPMRLIIADRS